MGEDSDSLRRLGGEAIVCEKYNSKVNMHTKMRTEDITSCSTE
jgi:hypothetical protein